MPRSTHTHTHTSHQQRESKESAIWRTASISFCFRTRTPNPGRVCRNGKSPRNGSEKNRFTFFAGYPALPIHPLLNAYLISIGHKTLPLDTHNYYTLPRRLEGNRLVRQTLCTKGQQKGGYVKQTKQQRSIESDLKFGAAKKAAPKVSFKRRMGSSPNRGCLILWVHLVAGSQKAHPSVTVPFMGIIVFLRCLLRLRCLAQRPQHQLPAFQREHLKLYVFFMPLFASHTPTF